MNSQKISLALISVFALSAMPALASELAANTSHSANVFTVKFVKTDSVKGNTKAVSSNLGISKDSSVRRVNRFSSRDNSKVLILGGSEVIPM